MFFMPNVTFVDECVFSLAALTMADSFTIRGTVMLFRVSPCGISILTRSRTCLRLMHSTPLRCAISFDNAHFDRKILELLYQCLNNDWIRCCSSVPCLDCYEVDFDENRVTSRQGAPVINEIQGLENGVVASFAFYNSNL